MKTTSYIVLLLVGLHVGRAFVPDGGMTCVTCREQSATSPVPLVLCSYRRYPAPCGGACRYGEDNEDKLFEPTAATQVEPMGGIPTIPTHDTIDLACNACKINVIPTCK